jgi:hypothetical protein
MLKKYGDQRFIGASLGSATGAHRRTTAPCLAEQRDSKRRINHLRKNIAVEEALAPSGVQIRKRFARRYFAGRFAGGLQFLNTIARRNQHVAKLGQIGFVAQRAMPRNDLSVVVDQGENFVGGDNHPVDFFYYVTMGAVLAVLALSATLPLPTFHVYAA